MSEKLYKAVLRAKLSLSGTPFTTTMNNIKTALLIERACMWLVENRREAHLVQSYNNADAHTCEAVIVLRDRDTALMLKLALQRD